MPGPPAGRRGRRPDPPAPAGPRPSARADQGPAPPQPGLALERAGRRDPLQRRQRLDGLLGSARRQLDRPDLKPGSIDPFPAALPGQLAEQAQRPVAVAGRGERPRQTVTRPIGEPAARMIGQRPLVGRPRRGQVVEREVDVAEVSPGSLQRRMIGPGRGERLQRPAPPGGRRSSRRARRCDNGRSATAGRPGLTGGTRRTREAIPGIAPDRAGRWPGRKGHRPDPRPMARPRGTAHIRRRPGRTSAAAGARARIAGSRESAGPPRDPANRPPGPAPFRTADPNRTPGRTHGHGRPQRGPRPAPPSDVPHRLASSSFPQPSWTEHADPRSRWQGPESRPVRPLQPLYTELSSVLKPARLG